MLAHDIVQHGAEERLCFLWIDWIRIILIKDIPHFRQQALFGCKRQSYCCVGRGIISIALRTKRKVQRKYAT